MKHVFVTIGVQDARRDADGFLQPGISSWTTLLVDENNPNFDRIVADTARLMGQKALLGHLRPTSAQEGGRG